MSLSTNLKKEVSLKKAGLSNIAIYIVAAFLMFYSLILVAQRFGGSEGSDAYFFLFSLVTVSTALASSIFTTVLIPVFVNLRVKMRTDDLSKLVGFILLWTLLVTSLLALISYVNYEKFFLIVSKFPSAEIARTRGILINFAPIVVASVLAEYFRALLLGLGKYSSAAVTAVFQPLILILFLVFFSDQSQEESLALSLLASKLIALVFMAIVVIHKERVRVRFVFIHRLPSISSFKSAASFWSASFVTNTSTFFFDYMATGLGIGVITAVSYAQRVFSLPVTLILNPLLEVAYTNFSELHARNDMKTFGLRYKILLQLVLFLSIPIAIFFFCMSDGIISSLFQRGAFGKDSVQIASNSLRVFSLAIVPTCIFMLNGRAIESFRKLVWPSFFGTLGNLFLMFIIYRLVGVYGYLGIPYARTLIYWAYFLPLGFITLYIFNKSMGLSGGFRTLFIATLASILPMGLYFYMDSVLALSVRFPSLALLGITMVLFSIIYLVLILLMDKKTLKNIMPI